MGMGSFRCALLLLITAMIAAADGAIPVVIRSTPQGFQLWRGDQPYTVRGICGTERLDLAAAAGANSLRTYGHDRIDAILADAHRHGLTVVCGFWLPHDAGSYADPGFRARWRDEVTATARRIAGHPALLMWALGNEVNSGADRDETWRCIDDLAQAIKAIDPNHPVMTVLAGAPSATIARIATLAPNLDLLGLNQYGGLPGTPNALAQAPAYTKPYLITEWGPQGHWESPRAPWGRPVEADSAAKSATYRRNADLIASFAPRCFGSYVFLWGQKQERTPTWYSMFVENRGDLGLQAEACPTIDIMTAVWSGRDPTLRAPTFRGARIDGASAPAWLTLRPQQRVRVDLAADDADGDALRVVWEVLREPTQLGNGGSFEGRPQTVAGAVTPISAGSGSLALAEPGEYRLFAYILDGSGRVATWNLPLLVEGEAVAASEAPAPEATPAPSARPQRERPTATVRPQRDQAAIRDSALAERYDTDLFDRARSALAGGRVPRFRPAFASETCAIAGIDADRVLDLHLGSGGRITLPWTKLSAKERLSLAQDCYGALPADQAALAHFHLAAGETAAARKLLRQAGSTGEAVATAWGVDP